MNEKWPQFHSLYLEMLYFYIFKPSPAVLFSMVFTYKVDSNCDIMLIVLVLKGSCKIQIFFSFQTALQCCLYTTKWPAILVITEILSVKALTTTNWIHTTLKIKVTKGYGMIRNFSKQLACFLKYTLGRYNK